MKEFNLTEYLKNPSQKVVTRDGREVRIICTDANNDFPIIALVYCSDNKEDICTYHKNGHTLNTYESPNDLFFAPVKREGWINIYRLKDDKRTIGCVFESEEEAKKKKSQDNYIDTIKIEWEE